MTDRAGKVYEIDRAYYPAIGAAEKVDASGHASLYGLVLSRAPDDAAYHATTAGKAIGTGEFTGEVATVYFDTHGDGTGTSMALWTTQLRLLDGSLVTAVLPDVDLHAVSPEQTISFYRGDAAD